MSYEEIISLIRGEGYTEYQAITIYDEMNCGAMTSETEIMDAVSEWEDMQLTMERCRGEK